MKLLPLLLLLLTGCLPLSMDSTLPYDHTCSDEALAGLAPVVRESMARVAAEYAQATGERLTVTSAHRTLHHTASLMAHFSQEQLEGMYCRHGYPSYIRQIVAARAAKGGSLTTEETYQILRNRTEGFISSHLSGGAVDIATEGLSHKELLRNLLEQNDFTTLDETSLGVQCIHATHKKVPKLIIRD
ncbi:MAG: hypothetical protein IJJ26_11940 [Victivallales bacterium]|nr:hypothetical protein [Victivallales bacterium]